MFAESPLLDVTKQQKKSLTAEQLELNDCSAVIAAVSVTLLGLARAMYSEY